MADWAVVPQGGRSQWKMENLSNNTFFFREIQLLPPLKSFWHFIFIFIFFQLCFYFCEIIKKSGFYVFFCKNEIFNVFRFKHLEENLNSVRFVGIFVILVVLGIIRLQQICCRLAFRNL